MTKEEAYEHLLRINRQASSCPTSEEEKGWTINKRWKRKISNQQIIEAAKHKLEQNSELWKEQSEYVKLEDDETRILRFNPEKIKHVEGQYGTRIQYAVIDPNYLDKEKKFEQGKTTSKEIDKHLSQGHLLLKIQRIGSGKDTKYIIHPAD